MTSTILAQCVLTGFKIYKWLLQENPDLKSSRTKEIKPKTPKSNTGFIDDSDDSSIISQSDSEDVCIHGDTGSLIRVL